jgi:hypothetical protein
MASTETVPAPQARENGLSTYFQVLYAPSEAFDKLARTPMWGWAALIGLLLTLIATIIGLPATVHMIHATQAQQLSQMSADQVAQQREALAKVPEWVYGGFGIVGSLVGPWLYWLIAAAIFLIGAALGGGETRFQLAWVAAVNAYVIAGVGSIVTYSIIALRGASNINAPTDFYALPSLAMLVHGSPKLAGLLYAYNIVNVWYYIVAVIALERMLKLGRGAAVATVVVMSLLVAGLAALFAK